MDGDARPVPAQLQAWRDQGAERMDPVRFVFIDALARRAGAQQGEARRLLDARLSGLVQAYAADLRQWRARIPQQPTPAAPTAGGELRRLLAALHERAVGCEAAAAEAGADALPAPDALASARRLWTQVRTDSQLRASLDALPAGAGPLNSAMLVHRALHAMRVVSPGYLQHFIAYADMLSSLEQLRQDLGPSGPGGANAAQPSRRAARRRGSRSR